MVSVTTREQTGTNKGLTILELLIVVAIIGVIATIVLFAIDDSRGQARFSTAASQLQEIRNAAEIHKTDTGEFAQTESPGTPPDFVDEYLSDWPEPPCNDYSYQWEHNSSNGMVRASLRDSNDDSVLYVCLVESDSGGCGNGDDITERDSRSLVCS